MCSNRASYTQAYQPPVQSAQAGMQTVAQQTVPAPAPAVQQPMQQQTTMQQPMNTGYVQQGPWGQQTPINPAAIPSSPASLDSMPPPVMPTPASMPETLSEYIYTPGYLRANIGALMRVEFLIGNNITDRVGILREVGASYIVLDALNVDSRMMCDIYSIRFITILGPQPASRNLVGAF